MSDRGRERPHRVLCQLGPAYRHGLRDPMGLYEKLYKRNLELSIGSGGGRRKHLSLQGINSPVL